MLFLGLVCCLNNPPDMDGGRIDDDPRIADADWNRAGCGHIDRVPPTLAKDESFLGPILFRDCDWQVDENRGTLADSTGNLDAGSVHRPLH